MKVITMLFLIFTITCVLHAAANDGYIYWKLDAPDSTQTVVFSDSLLSAAKSGNAHAQLELAICYDSGAGIAADPGLAVKWYQASAQQGNGYAQANLGGCYAEGYGVPKDEKQALKWYRLSADQGCPMGQFNLGLAYETGMGVRKDLQEARRLYQLAANKGDANALVSLGDYYQFGMGVKKDLPEAAFWYLLADQFGCDTAFDKYMALLPNFSEQQEQDIEARADRWLKELK